MTVHSNLRLQNILTENLIADTILTKKNIQTVLYLKKKKKNMGQGYSSAAQPGKHKVLNSISGTKKNKTKYHMLVRHHGTYHNPGICQCESSLECIGRPEHITNEDNKQSLPWGTANSSSAWGTE